MTEPLVHLESVTTGYHTTPVLRNVDLEVYPGDFMGIIGPNGGGKTTLIKLILGLQPLFKGKLHFPAGRPRMGYLPQASQVDRSFPITVKELVSSGMKTRKAWVLFSQLPRGKGWKACLKKPDSQVMPVNPLGS